jgi:hypothetical protein
VAQLLKPDGTIFEINPVNGEKFSNEELKQLLETDKVELIPLPNNLQLGVDSESRRNRSYPVNHIATLLVRETGAKGPLDFVVGKAVVLEDWEIQR